MCRCFRSQARLSSPQMHEGDFICLPASLPFMHGDDFLCVSVSGHTHGCQAHKHMTCNYPVTFVSLCVPNASVDYITRTGTVGMSREACLCFTRSHIRVLIAETQRFDERLLLLGCEQHVAPLRKPKGPTSISSRDAALAHRLRPAPAI